MEYRDGNWQVRTRRDVDELRSEIERYYRDVWPGPWLGLEAFLLDLEDSIEWKDGQPLDFGPNRGTDAIRRVAEIVGGLRQAAGGVMVIAPQAQADKLTAERDTLLARLIEIDRLLGKPAELEG